jgi:hypothetical protein
MSTTNQIKKNNSTNPLLRIKIWFKSSIYYLRICPKKGHGMMKYNVISKEYYCPKCCPRSSSKSHNIPDMVINKPVETILKKNNYKQRTLSNKL